MILPILKHPNDILRKKSTPVTDVAVSDIQKLIANMIDTMYAAKGIGIAAPQIGHSKRVIIVKTEDEPLALINPVIIKKSFRKESGEEGCLSIPGIFGTVRRYKKITVEALDTHGNKVTFEASDLFARVIQHEIDHIDGILFIDRAKKIYREEKIEKIDRKP